MKQLMIIVYFLLASLSGVTAQHSVDFMARSRHYIGVNIHPVISHIVGTVIDTPTEVVSYTPFEIFYKRQVRDSDRAWRFGLLIDYNYAAAKRGPEDTTFLYDGWSVIDYDKYSGWKYSIGMYGGHEWQTVLGKRWLLGYGIDLKYLFAYRDGEGEYKNSFVSKQQQYEALYRSRENSYQHIFYFNPFVEINFAVTSYLTVNVGCSLSFIYTYYKTKSQDRWSPVGGFTQINVNANRKFHLGLHPFRQINLIYSF